MDISSAMNTLGERLQYIREKKGLTQPPETTQQPGISKASQNRLPTLHPRRRFLPTP